MTRGTPGIPEGPGQAEESDAQPLLGILGGMGPLASAEFLRTLYRYQPLEPEQRSLRTVMISDPSFPDRTEAILREETAELAHRLEAAIESLLALGAERVVIPCITIHHLVPALPAELRRRVDSLIDVVVEEVLARRDPCLLLATTGTRAARIFERHERWRQVEPFIRTPTAAEQRDLHEWLYRLKKHGSAEECLQWLLGLAARHDVKGLIFGCTELHLLQRSLESAPLGGCWVVDPLLSIAQALGRPAVPQQDEASVASG
ncbi:MAG TPA: aspartate/glutamate racemase family protein [Thermoanaerobaculia bacterium]|jgi:aspartate racemase|nr:aspartate/glutamate racemase family protein [Thermoanaerobaculia bacterium]